MKDIVKNEYMGDNAKELAKIWGYSERRIRQFVSSACLDELNIDELAERIAKKLRDVI